MAQRFRIKTSLLFQMEKRECGKVRECTFERAGEEGAEEPYNGTIGNQFHCTLMRRVEDICKREANLLIRNKKYRKNAGPSRK